MLFLVIGARGAGKTTLVKNLEKTGSFKVLQPSTTRQRRSASESEYDFVKVWESELYGWEIQVGPDTYGMRKCELDLAGSNSCLTVFDPLNISTLEKFEANAPFEVVTVGLDTLRDLSEQHIRVDNDQARMMDQDEFTASVEVTRKADLVVRGGENQVAEALVAAHSILANRGGILSKRHLAPLIGAGAVLEGELDKKSLKGASYDLSIGSQVWCNGKLLKLTDEQPIFTIPPYSYAVVTAREEAWLPTFIAGTFDIKVGLFLRGTILSNGPQVDPGYRGPLFCMLFNGSSDSIRLARNSHFSTIEFSTVTHKSPAYSDKYQLQSHLEEIMAEGGLSGQGGNIVEEFEQKHQDTKGRLDNIANWAIGIVGSTVLTVIAMLWTHFSIVQNKVNKINDLGFQFKYALELEENFRADHESSVSSEMSGLRQRLDSLTDELVTRTSASAADNATLTREINRLERSVTEIKRLFQKLQNGE